MLEESRMDKKSINRSTQSQSRANAVDCKKNSEVTHKPWPRNNKKREGNGTTPKNEPYRKNTPSQRGRGQIDRRPRPRGPTDFAVGGTQNPGQTCDLYLKFFDYKKDPEQEMGKHISALKNISTTVVRSNGRSECPICLGVPVAGRVGHCGHVYCWPCVLHYAQAHDKQPPPCPVCATPLHVDDMKPALMMQWEITAEEVTMRLVRRLRGSTTVEVAPLRGQVTEEGALSIMPLDNIKDAPYCKLFSANKKQVQDIMLRERKEIEKQILEEIDTTEIVFLEQALEMLKQKDQSLTMQYEAPKLEYDENTIEEAPIVYEKQEISVNKLDWFDVTDEGAAAVDVVQTQIENLELSNLNPEAPVFSHTDIAAIEFPLTECLPPEPNVDDEVASVTDIDKQNQAKYFYFYQADDGQQVFLNSLNVRVLNASWGALAAAPQTIRGRVLHRETLPLSEQTRKHMPYTAHLPLYCAFDVVELDLQPPYVTTAALHNFKDELDRRARTRARQERDERRRERAWRRAVEGPPKPDFSSELLFPPAATVFPSSPPDSGQLLTFEQPSLSTSVGSPAPSGPSFAKMASTSGTWRVRKVTEPTPPPPPAEGEGSAPRTLSLSEAIEAALLAAPAPSPSPSAKKNKKSKHKVLFATGVQHAT
ncbi:hypothetical protein K1T71_004064 [Dendrolimus kikuchii]|uniref:Uncharacterized protein n=1 Tax=Dendrolimus kikuchii TaxID=765133 RepID=A0ACC1D9X1_9NEOP|nr:hypothetical protein K1T71_004064 [Dendrolimus kikuchii]